MSVLIINTFLSMKYSNSDNKTPTPTLDWLTYICIARSILLSYIDIRAPPLAGPLLVSLQLLQLNSLMPKSPVSQTPETCVSPVPQLSPKASINQLKETLSTSNYYWRAFIFWSSHKLKDPGSSMLALSALTCLPTTNLSINSLVTLLFRYPVSQQSGLTLKLPQTVLMSDHESAPAFLYLFLSLGSVQSWSLSPFRLILLLSLSPSLVFLQSLLWCPNYTKFTFPDCVIRVIQENV